MTAPAYIAATILFVIAVFHIYWAFGGVWPGKDEASAARTVAGFEGMTKMPPPAAAIAVALAVSVAALLALALAGTISLPMPDWLVRLASWGAAAVFISRGIAGYMPAWRRLTPEQPFATLDKRLYSPLCMLLGLCFVVLLLS